jgi:hypothetical protein
MPYRPSTPAANRHVNEQSNRNKLSHKHEPIQKLIQVLDEVDLDSDGRITSDELSLAIQKSGVTDAELISIFNSNDREKIFSHIDVDSDKKIDFAEILNFLDSIGVDVTTQLVGFPARHPKTVLDFALNMLDAVSRDLTRANYQSIDRKRTVPINTDYVGTTTFDLESEDFGFLIETGRIHTESFLKSLLS